MTIPQARPLVDGVVGGPGPAASAAALAPERWTLPRWATGLLGAAFLVGLWEVLALTMFHPAIHSGVPTPPAVLGQFLHRDLFGYHDAHGQFHKAIYGRNVRQTVGEAFTGFVVANLAAIALAIAFVQVPVIEKALLRIAIASYCLPILAIGPILTFVLHGDAPKSALAGLLCFFPTLVGTVLGLRSADRASLDVIRASGGGTWAQLVKVRLRAAIPSTFAALQIAAPSAMLGAIIGEFLGNSDYGLGILMINAQAELEVARLWGVALLTTGIGGLAYLLVGLLSRLAAPWAPRQERI